MIPPALWLVIAIPSCNGKTESENEARDRWDQRREAHSERIEANSPLVYVTATGDCYHTKSHYPYESQARPLVRAQAYLEPCMNCRPPKPIEYPRFSEPRPKRKSRSVEGWTLLGAVLAMLSLGAAAEG